MTYFNMFKGFLNKRIGSFKERVEVVFVSAFVWGLIAHGYVFFNKFSYHDDIGLLYGSSNVSGYIEFGRFSSALLSWILEKFFLRDLSVPAFKGMAMLFFIAVFWIVFSEWFKIESFIGTSLITGVLVVCTTVTASLGYMFSAYNIGLHFIIPFIGCWLFMKNPTLLRSVFGLVICIFSIGLYQADFISIITILCFGLLMDVLDSDKMDWRGFLKEAIKYFGFAFVSLIGYLLTNHLIQSITNIKAASYYGLDKMGHENPVKYLIKIPKAVITFFDPNRYTYGNPYPQSALKLYHCIMLVLSILVVITVVRLYQEHGWYKVAQFAAVLTVIPIAIELLIMVSPNVTVHSMYSHNFSYFLLMILAERCTRQKNIIKFSLPVRNLFFALLLLINICFTQYANACYLKAEFLQTHAISYFNSMIARMEMLEGFTPEMTVYFAEENQKLQYDEISGAFDYIQTEPYEGRSLINNYLWFDFMRTWCNFKNPITHEPSEYFEMEEIADMPIYPADGSMKIINGCIVIKFNDTLI